MTTNSEIGRGTRYRGTLAAAGVLKGRVRTAWRTKWSVARPGVAKRRPHLEVESRTTSNAGIAVAAMSTQTRNATTTPVRHQKSETHVRKSRCLRTGFFQYLPNHIQIAQRRQEQSLRYASCCGRGPRQGSREHGQPRAQQRRTVTYT